jgi:actin-related protein
MADDDDYEEISDEVIIIDNGSGMCKAGLSSSELPTVVFPEVMGRPRKEFEAALKPKARQIVNDRGGTDSVFFGDQVDSVLGQVTLSNPIVNGIIESMEDMESIWAHTFEQLGMLDEATSHPVLLTEPPHNPKQNREKVVEIMFEQFGVPELNISIQGVLALTGRGHTTGVVLDCGEGVSHTIPVIEGYCIDNAIQRLDLAGGELNTLLGKLLAQEHLSMTTSSDRYHLRQMKEKHCYCALDPAREVAEEVIYKLPDGREVSLKDERWKCPEALFDPSRVGLEAMGVGGMVWDTVSECPLDVRRQLLQSITLSGGSTLFPGFKQRLTKEIQNLAPLASQSHIAVSAREDQQFVVWKGAKVCAEFKNLKRDVWMTFADYDEIGKNYIHELMAISYS